MTKNRPVRWAGALVLGGLVLVLGSGCKSKESEPVAVARAFADAARRSDVDGILAVVERPAVDYLELAAERASDQVGGRRSIERDEMLQIVGVDRTVAVASAELIDDDGKRAHVELTMTDGREMRLELVWEQVGEQVGQQVGEQVGQQVGQQVEQAPEDRAGAWKVRIPLPSADPLQGPVQGPADPLQAAGT